MKIITAEEAAKLLRGATPGPWRHGREPAPTVNPWFDAHKGDEPIESRGTAFAFGVAVAVSAETRDAALIAAAPDLAATVTYLWGRLAEVERERDADLGRMQNVVYDALVSGVKSSIPDADVGRIDGAGSDGDEFEFTSAEVSIALSMMDDEIERVKQERDDARAQLATYDRDVSAHAGLAAEETAKRAIETLESSGYTDAAALLREVFHAS